MNKQLEKYFEIIDNNLEKMKIVKEHYGVYYRESQDYRDLYNHNNKILRKIKAMYFNPL